MKTRAFGSLHSCLRPQRLQFHNHQATPQVPPSIVVKAGKLLDVRKGAYIENAAIWVEGERIKEVGLASDVQRHAPKDAKVIDLGRATVLPGLIDWPLFFT